MDERTIHWLENLVQGKLKPDLTLLFDAPVEIGLERARQRGSFDRFEQEKLSFFKNVRQAYLKQAELNPARIKLIAADRTLTEVQSSIIAEIESLFE